MQPVEPRRGVALQIAELHERLPKESQSKEFYKSFTAKFIGLVLLLFALISFIF